MTISPADAAGGDAIRRIVVAEAQVPFVEGGAELHVRSLVEQLRRRGYDAEKVAVPLSAATTR